MSFEVTLGEKRLLSHQQPALPIDQAAMAMDAAPRTVGVRELKARASEIIRDVEATRATVLISRNGKPRAYLIPALADSGPTPVLVPQPAPARTALRGAFPTLPVLPDAAFRTSDA